MAERFDAIIIGTGQAGPALAQRMTREGEAISTLRGSISRARSRYTIPSSIRRSPFVTDTTFELPS